LQECRYVCVDGGYRGPSRRRLNIGQSTLLSLRITPAMAAGVSDHAWEIGEIVDVLEKWERKEQVRRVMAAEN